LVEAPTYVPDTIYALSSGAGAAGVAMVRISGPASDELLGALGVRELPAPRYAALHNIMSPVMGSRVDQALVLRFPGPDSFTGEDVVELHVHGGQAVLAALFEALGASGLVRLAEPGEFTRRSFENGKLDLTAAEAIGDLVSAQTDAQRIQALQQYDGGLAELYGRWRSELINLLGNAEAEIDFSDEELPEALHEKVVQTINTIKQEVVKHSSSTLLGEQIRSGFPISILGAPNVGKSSLMNILARRDVVIVSEIAGTTRDVVEGVRRAEQRARDAALKLVVIAADEAVVPDRIRKLIDQNTILVVNKIDVLDRQPDLLGFPEAVQTRPVSAQTGEGIDTLLAGVTALVRERLASREGVVPTRQRHRLALEDAVTALDRAASAALPELAAEDVRLAVRALGRITGRVDIDDVLDTVFRDFCIGK
jgi:tRNA modification GTPase